MAWESAHNGDAKIVQSHGATLGCAAQVFLAADTLHKDWELFENTHVVLGLRVFTALVKACEAKQPIRTTSGGVRWALLTPLRTSVHERCTPGWAA